MDLAVVGGGCEEDAVFGVGPGDTPDGAFVAVVLVSLSYRARKCGIYGGSVIWRTLAASVVICVGRRLFQKS